MQNQSERNIADGMGRRSSVERLPPALRDAVDAAIEGGATIEEIVACIHERGGNCSRSAVGRYAKRMRELIREQREVDRCADLWIRVLGERAQGRTGLIAIEAVRTLALKSVGDLRERETPVATEEVARLALALRRIESADKLRAERERALGQAAARGGRAARQRGLSAETVAAIRRAIEGPPPPEPPP